MVICLERGADLDMAQLMTLPLTVSYTHIHIQIYIAPKIVRTNLRRFSKIQTELTFLVPANPGSPGQRVVKWLCVVMVYFAFFC